VTTAKNTAKKNNIGDFFFLLGSPIASLRVNSIKFAYAPLLHNYQDNVLGHITFFAARTLYKFLDEMSYRSQVIPLPPDCPELNDTEHIPGYPKDASLVNF
jgi:hypothetical protein